MADSADQHDFVLRNSRALTAARLLEIYAIPFFCALLVLVATQVTMANLPANKVFAGHDSGFYNLYPEQLIRTSAGTWEVKDAFGFPNFQALVTLPYALAVMLFHAMHLSGAAVGRVFFELQLLILELGTFWLSWIVLDRTFPTTSRTIRALCSFGAAFVASFNIFTAILMLYPPSTFQASVMMWPLIAAFELYLLWHRPRISTALLFGVTLIPTTIGNPAHTILGLFLLLAIYVANALASRQWYPKIAFTAAVVFFTGTSYVWLPALSSLLFYHGGVTAPEGTDALSLVRSQELVVQRASIAALLRFDGLLWWARTRNAELYRSFPMLVATFVPAVVAIFAILTRKRLAVGIWVLLLLGVELAKGVHPPFSLNMLWLMTHVPLFAAFRETYDKFTLYIVIALPIAFSIGLMFLYQLRLAGKIAGSIAIALVIFSAWPFLSGRIVEPYFLTTVPSDYVKVDQIMGGDPQTRVLSLPGGGGEIHVTNWFKGGNFENFLYRAHVVNAAIFKARSISSAPLYDDLNLQQPRELPELIGLLGMYGIDYVLLHKDYLTSYRMAFDYERYKVLGPLIAKSSERFLDSDARLQKVYAGSNLVLYRVRSYATLPHAYGSYEVGLESGYENNLFGVSNAGITDANRHPLILFDGHQPGGRMIADSLQGNLLLRKSTYLVRAPLIDESTALYREQIKVPSEAVEAVTAHFEDFAKPTYYIFVQPHGDWLSGLMAPKENLLGSFSSRSPQRATPRVVVEANSVPKEVVADFFGTEGVPGWPVRSFSNEATPDDDLADGAAIHEAASRIAPDAPVSTVASATSIAYQFRLASDAKSDEYIVARQPSTPQVALLEDPKVTFDYEMSAPNVTDAWLRFDLTGPDGRRLFLDKELDPAGRLLDYDLRDGMQTALDQRFDQLLELHQTDPQWIASQRFYNPEQADAYRLAGIRLIVGKRHAVDLSGAAANFSFSIRALRIRLTGAIPSVYPNRGFSKSFVAAKVRATTSNFSSIYTSVENGALLVNASIRNGRLETEQTLAGHIVGFKLKDGSTIVASVVKEKADAYIITDATRTRPLSKTLVDSIVSVAAGGPGVYSITMPLPYVDVNKYPEMHVRYLQGNAEEQVRLRVGMKTRNGTIELEPGLGVATFQDTGIPADAVHNANALGRQTSVVLGDKLLPASQDIGWKEALFDMREVESYRARSLHAIPTYVKLDFVVPPPTSQDQSISSSFGFGDVSFVGQTPLSQLRRPTGSTLTLDGRRLSAITQRHVGNAPDILSLDYPALTLSRGTHRVTTGFDQPWSPRTVALAPSAIRSIPSYPALTISHIDDELYAVHVNANKAYWISFAETYHQGWRLVEGPPPRNRLEWLLSLRWLHSVGAVHLVGNAYNNSWYVDNPDHRDFVIDFAAQDFAVMGMGFALLSTLGALAVASFLWRR